MKNPYKPDPNRGSSRNPKREPKLEPNPEATFEKMLGFGDRSIRKSYYPELQKTIVDLKHAEERYYNIFRNALNGIYQFSAGGELLDANPAFINALGFASLEEARQNLDHKGKALFETPEDLKDILNQLRAEHKVEKRITRLLKNDSTRIWVSINAVMVFDNRGQTAYIEGYIEDVTSRVEAENALKQMTEELERLVFEKTRALEEANQKLVILSNTDGLTGIANRRSYDDVLATEWRRAARLGHPLALAMLDIDLFKNYNDLYGHVAGDDCLRQVAAVLMAHARRAGDFAARYGGEEFVLILPAAETQKAFQLAESIRISVEQLAVPHEGSPHGIVTVSIGLAAMRPGDNDMEPDQLLKMADAAMYRAKRQGRNQVALSDASV